MSKTKTIVVALLAMLFFWAAGLQNTALLRAKGEYRAGRPLENAPPLIVFTTVVLGGFSGILADLLWLRVSYLQDDGKYLEMVQLSDWITKLEPRCAEIWSFHAWNMAYNVSVLMPDMEDRWRWVSNGMRLLRDEGLRYNPADAELCLELAWLFENKIGGATDTAHMYHKYRWAAEMTELFGGARPDYEALPNDPAKTQVMEKDYKLTPAVMKEVDEAYGPLDWRMPYAHAIYWAHTGRKLCPPEKNLIRYDRMIYQAMVMAFAGGRVVSCESRENFAVAPDLDMLDGTLREFDSVMTRYSDQNVASAHMHFLRHAVFLLRGREADSRRVFEILRAKYPSDETGKGYESFLDFMRNEMEHKKGSMWSGPAQNNE